MMHDFPKVPTRVGSISSRFQHSSRTRMVLLAVGVVVVLLLASHWFSDIFGGGKAKKGPTAVPVDAASVTRSDVPIYAEGLGTVQAFYTVTVTARVDGQLETVAFTEGQNVKKGDLLAQIDSRPYQAALDLSVATKEKDAAQLANAKADLERYVLLAPEEFTSKQTLDTQRSLVAQLEAQVKGDQAMVDNARTQLDYTKITSPINGRTGIRLVDPGNNVRAADTTGIVVVTQLQPISVIFTLPESLLPSMTTAMNAGPVKVTALSQDGKTVLDEGTISLIDNRIDQTTGSIRVKATFPNAHDTLWPGEFVNARALLETRKNVLTIPPEALQRGPEGTFAYVIQPDSTVKVAPVTVLGNSETTVIVESGLNESDRVVTSNQYRLQPGVAIQVRGAATSAASAGSARKPKP